MTTAEEGGPIMIQGNGPSQDHRLPTHEKKSLKKTIKRRYVLHQSEISPLPPPIEKKTKKKKNPKSENYKPRCPFKQQPLPLTFPSPSPSLRPPCHHPSIHASFIGVSGSHRTGSEMAIQTHRLPKRIASFWGARVNPSIIHLIPALSWYSTPLLLAMPCYRAGRQRGGEKKGWSGRSKC